MSKQNFNKFLMARKIILFILTLLFMSSCGLPYCKKVPFSEADLTWLDPYSVGDTILFECGETNSVDTMIITGLDICNPPNTSIFDLRGCNWMEGDNEFKAVANLTFDMLHNSEKIESIFTLRKKCNKKPATCSIGFLGNYSKTHLSTGDTIKRYVNDLNVQGTLVINDTTLKESLHQSVIPVNKIYWNRENGLTGYQIGDNTYRLKSKLLGVIN